MGMQLTKDELSTLVYELVQTTLEECYSELSVEQVHGVSYATQLAFEDALKDIKE